MISIEIMTSERGGGRRADSLSNRSCTSTVHSLEAPLDDNTISWDDVSCLSNQHVTDKQLKHAQSPLGAIPDDPDLCGRGGQGGSHTQWYGMVGSYHWISATSLKLLSPVTHRLPV